MKAPGSRRNLELPVLALSLAAAWNYWLPMAEDFYNQVTEANELRNRDLQNVDFFAYYLAGARFAEGQNPYYFDQGGQRLYAEFVYPPTFLPLYRALSSLPYEQARLLWLALYLAGYAAVAAVVVRAALPEHRSTLLALSTLLTFLSFPFLMHIHNGQSDVFVIVLILLGWAAYARGGWLPASILFALATLAKVNPALFLVYFALYRRDARFVFGFALTCAVVGLVSLAFVPASLYRDYIFDVLPQVTRGTDYWPNQSLLRFIPAAYGSLAPAVTAAGLGLFAAFAVWIGRRHPADQRRGARQLPRLAAAGGRLRARRAHRPRPHDRAARHRPGRPPGPPLRDLADSGGDRGDDAHRGARRAVPAPVLRRLHRRRDLAGAPRPRG